MKKTIRKLVSCLCFKFMAGNSRCNGHLELQFIKSKLIPERRGLASPNQFDYEGNCREDKHWMKHNKYLCSFPWGRIAGQEPNCKNVLDERGWEGE